jgi:Reverse transcriptase (RNA-dependent DNA polymerase)
MKPSLSGERVEGDSSDADFQVSTDDHEVSELV